MNFDSTALKTKLQTAHKQNLHGLTNVLKVCLALTLVTAILTGINNKFQFDQMVGGLLFSGVLFAICLILFVIILIAKNKFTKRLETFKDLIIQGYVANQCYTWGDKKQASVHFRKAEQTDKGEDVAIKMPVNESMIVMRSIRNSIVNNIPSKIKSHSPARNPLEPKTLTSSQAPLVYAPAPVVYDQEQEPVTYPPAPSTYYPAPTGYYATPSTPQSVPEGYQHDSTDYQPSATTVRSTATTYHPVVTRYSRMPHLK